jgi:hypothetical protein
MKSLFPAQEGRPMSPRKLREHVDGGFWEATVKSPPAPPPEWGKFRKKRMRAAIKAAWWFLHGDSLDDIMARMIRAELIPRKVSRARIGQYVDKGTEFLLQRKAYEPKGI